MTPEMVQLLYLAGAAVLGWFLRHRGLGAPSSPSSPTPVTPTAFPTLPPNWQPNWKLAGPHPVLDALSQWMLDQLAETIKNQTPATPAVGGK